MSHTPTKRVLSPKKIGVIATRLENLANELRQEEGLSMFPDILLSDAQYLLRYAERAQKLEQELTELRAKLEEAERDTELLNSNLLAMHIRDEFGDEHIQVHKGIDIRRAIRHGIELEGDAAIKEKQ